MQSALLLVVLCEQHGGNSGPERGATERQVASRVQALLDRYGAGIELMSVRLLYVHPPTEVHDAFRDVASAQEDKLRTIDRAQTFAV